MIINYIVFHFWAFATNAINFNAFCVGLVDSGLVVRIFSL